MMTDEKTIKKEAKKLVKEVSEEIEEENKESKKAPEKKPEKKEIYTPEPPKATVPKTTVPATTTPKPDTVSGIDVTANMDNDQKELFKTIKAKSQVIPHTPNVERPFCKRSRELRERRQERMAERKEKLRKAWLEKVKKKG